MGLLDNLKKMAEKEIENAKKIGETLVNSDKGIVEDITNVVFGNILSTNKKDPLLEAIPKNDGHLLELAYALYYEMAEKYNEDYKKRFLEYTSNLEKRKPAEVYYLLAGVYKNGLPFNDGRLFPADMNRFRYYVDKQKEYEESLYCQYHSLFGGRETIVNEDNIKKVEELSEKGQPNATIALAKQYIDFKTGVVRDYGKGLQYLKLASDQGSPDATNFMSRIYGELGNYVLASKYCEQAINEGCIDATKISNEYKKKAAQQMKTADVNKLLNMEHEFLNSKNETSNVNFDNYQTNVDYNYDQTYSTDYSYDNGQNNYENNSFDNYNNEAYNNYNDYSSYNNDNFSNYDNYNNYNDYNNYNNYNNYDDSFQNNGYDYNNSYNQGMNDALYGNAPSNYSESYQRGYEENLSYEQWDKYRNGEDPFKY